MEESLHTTDQCNDRSEEPPKITLYTVRDAAKLLGVSDEVINALIEEGDLSAESGINSDSLGNLQAELNRSPFPAECAADEEGPDKKPARVRRSPMNDRHALLVAALLVYLAITLGTIGLILFTGPASDGFAWNWILGIALSAAGIGSLVVSARIWRNSNHSSAKTASSQASRTSWRPAAPRGVGALLAGTVGMAMIFARTSGDAVVRGTRSTAKHGGEVGKTTLRGFDKFLETSLRFAQGRAPTALNFYKTLRQSSLAELGAQVQSDGALRIEGVYMQIKTTGQEEAYQHARDGWYHKLFSHTVNSMVRVEVQPGDEQSPPDLGRQHSASEKFHAETHGQHLHEGTDLALSSDGANTYLHGRERYRTSEDDELHVFETKDAVVFVNGDWDSYLNGQVVSFRLTEDAASNALSRGVEKMESVLEEAHEAAMFVELQRWIVKRGKSYDSALWESLFKAKATVKVRNPLEHLYHANQDMLWFSTKDEEVVDAWLWTELVKPKPPSSSPR